MTKLHESVERTVRIEAPTADVWRALTTVEGLENWFPIEADVAPGPGGSIRSRWDDTTWFEERIDAWDAERHLRTVGVGGGWTGIATDFYLSGDGGHTVLRVVSSGFGPDDDAQELRDSFGLGWSFELQGLKHYLEHHAGSRRAIVRAWRAYSGSVSDTWTLLTGPDGWLGVEAPAPQTALRTTTRTGDQLTGDVLEVVPNKQLVARLDSFGGSLIRLQVLPASVGRTVTIWLSAYGMDDGTRRDLESRWTAYLDNRVA